MKIDWNAELCDQFRWHYENHLQPRLAGLTDEEYLWEPVPHCWSVRPRAEAVTPMAAGGGDMVADFVYPEPHPAPFTTIAWRLAHVTVGIFAMRNSTHFGAPAISYQTAVYPASADEALLALDQAYRTWSSGIMQLDEEALTRPVGAGEPFPEAPFAALILHIHREAIHHLAEVLVLRDLYRLQG
ncbi:MAG TPA: DinB family protein [Streptosporangiaceae bacterium]|nr:DinB family protein [Streptosporangiaceae bacterium]